MGNLLIGADPEVFIQDIKTGEVETCIGLIPGTKEHPEVVNDVGSVHRDNVLCELNIQPAEHYSVFVYNIMQTLGSINELYLAPKGKQTLIKASHVYTDNEDLLMHPEAQAFGCEEDYNVWHLDTTRQINSGMAKNLRTAAGHIHIGFSGTIDVQAQIDTVLMCDLYIGVPSVLLDSDTVRRNLYGKAGCFRPKPYGIEYRTPSNFWLQEVKLMKWIYRQATTAYQHHPNRKHHNASLFPKVRKCIDTHDKDMAASIVEDLDIRMPPIVDSGGIIFDKLDFTTSPTAAPQPSNTLPPF